MESILGKKTRMLDQKELMSSLNDCQQVWIDIGTGDGEFVLRTARAHPNHFVIGVDACRENLRSASRKAPPNALFVIANALNLPAEFGGLAARLTINFPWGSLLAALLSAQPELIDSLKTLVLPGTLIEVRLNRSALLEAGCDLTAGGSQVKNTLRTAGFQVTSIAHLDRAGLQNCPTTWAKKLAFGRDPDAIEIKGCW